MSSDKFTKFFNSDAALAGYIIKYGHNKKERENISKTILNILKFKLAGDFANDYYIFKKCLYKLKNLSENASDLIFEGFQTLRGIVHQTFRKLYYDNSENQSKENQISELNNLLEAMDILYWLFDYLDKNTTNKNELISNCSMLSGLEIIKSIKSEIIVKTQNLDVIPDFYKYILGNEYKKMILKNKNNNIEKLVKTNDLSEFLDETLKSEISNLFEVSLNTNKSDASCKNEKEKRTETVGGEKTRNGFSGEEINLQLEEIKVNPELSFNDVILNPKTYTDVNLLINSKKYTDKFNEWNIKASMLYNNNSIKAIFFGQSGTGKTLTSHTIAAVLNKKLYKVNSEEIFQKWMGDSEKYAKEIFNAYRKLVKENEANPPILFIDEADGILGKRSDVCSKSDYTMNMVVNIFLQELESCPGFIICCTNLLLSTNIDSAFLRRFKFKIKFEYPQIEGRIQIMKKHLGSAPLEENIDLKKILEKHELSGGDIALCAEQAAYYAIEDNSDIIREKDIVRALNNEKNFKNNEYNPKVIRGFLKE